MPISLTYRSIKGSNLTADEVDANFQAIADWIAQKEANPTPPNGIANIVQEGSQITIYLDDATALGPFTLPSAVAILPFVEKSAASFTLALGDRNTLMNCTNAGGCVVSVPLDEDSSIPHHAEFHFRQGGGPISLDVPTDVTVDGVALLTEGTDRGGAVFTLKHTDEDDAWVIFGLLAEDDTGSA